MTMNNNNSIPTPTAPAVESASPFVDQVRAYVANRGSATLKQVQSRFKEVAYTCADYYELLSRNGFNVRGSGPAYSLYVVSA
jgi:hypothetical protein